MHTTAYENELHQAHARRVGIKARTKRRFTLHPNLQDDAESPSAVYWFSAGNHMVFYVDFDDVMEVRRFIYGARDLTKMLP
jgi:hypothetical protein